MLQVIETPYSGFAAVNTLTASDGKENHVALKSGFETRNQAETWLDRYKDGLVQPTWS